MNSQALANLRHLYQNLIGGGIKDAAEAKRIAEGLLGPAIEALEMQQAAPVEDSCGWIKWNGGDCPVDGNTLVDLEFNNHAIFQRAVAKDFDWGCRKDDSDWYDIIAYRISKGGAGC